MSRLVVPPNSVSKDGCFMSLCKALGFVVLVGVGSGLIYSSWSESRQKKEEAKARQVYIESARVNAEVKEAPPLEKKVNSVSVGDLESALNKGEASVSFEDNSRLAVRLSYGGKEYPVTVAFLDRYGKTESSFGKGIFIFVQPANELLIKKMLFPSTDNPFDLNRDKAIFDRRSVYPNRPSNRHNSDTGYNDDGTPREPVYHP